MILFLMPLEKNIAQNYCAKSTNPEREIYTVDDGTPKIRIESLILIKILLRRGR